MKLKNKTREGIPSAIKGDCFALLHEWLNWYNATANVAKDGGTIPGSLLTAGDTSAMVEKTKAIFDRLKKGND